MEWVTIVAGKFQMGSPESEPGRYTDEDQHEVTLTRDFVMLVNEVIQYNYLALMHDNPSYATNDPNRPVNMVSWYEAASFCNMLSEDEGYQTCYDCTSRCSGSSCVLRSEFESPYECLGYRLPTEAEWEYAARAGTTESTYNGTIDEAHLGREQPNPVLDPIAWFSGNSGGTKLGRQKLPNGFGFYDILGNLDELCNDSYAEYPEGSAVDPWGPKTGDRIVIRGGSFNSQAAQVRSASRYGNFHKNGYAYSLGFRPVRTLP